jgi:hypothetical protein
MRLSINLASRKYEDVRKFFIGWRVALAALGVCALLLAILAAMTSVSSAKSGKNIKELQAKVAAQQKERDRLAAIENSPENREVTQEKKFWNTQIAKRKFSWTQLFNDLQRIMPARARLVSVQPDLAGDNNLKLKLMIEGENRSNARELAVKMENSECFRMPKILVETAQKDSGSGATTYKFEIEAAYTPCATPGHTLSKEGI